MNRKVKWRYINYESTNNGKKQETLAHPRLRFFLKNTQNKIEIFLDGRNKNFLKMRWTYIIRTENSHVHKPHTLEDQRVVHTQTNT